MIKDSLNRCDSELASEIRKNIVVCGGSSITKGLQLRLEKEFEEEEEKHNFVLGWQRICPVWVRGSMLGSLSTFQGIAITSKDYNQAQSVEENKKTRLFLYLFN